LSKNDKQNIKLRQKDYQELKPRNEKSPECNCGELMELVSVYRNGGTTKLAFKCNDCKYVEIVSLKELTDAEE
jgi:hypothetical protein